MRKLSLNNTKLKMESGEETRRKAHVLVLPFPVQGHINPMLQFSKRLVSKGIKVTFITSTSIGNFTYNQTSSINIETIFDGFKQGEKSSVTVDQYFKRYMETVPQSLERLIQKYRYCCLRR